MIPKSCRPFEPDHAHIKQITERLLQYCGAIQMGPLTTVPALARHRKTA